jgi:hypothetical protein
MLRFVNLAHPAAAELFESSILPELAGLERLATCRVDDVCAINFATFHVMDSKPLIPVF